MKRCLVMALMALALVGCVTISPQLTADRAAYLVGKDTAYGLWRFEAVKLADLQKAKAPLNALLTALGAQGEAELDANIQAYLDGWLSGLQEVDREILSELVAETLKDIQLKDPEALADNDRAVLAALIGGMLDGIVAAERAASLGS
ncbi:MAG TPA: hypothetical protein VMY87_11115 [Armatimonadota bacterium]|nr:hypothetical protein [Armatimonadota bacterium]